MKGLTVGQPECQLALRQLEAYLADPDGGTGDLALALAHVGACPRCKSRLRFLGRALAHAGADRLTCAECEADLPWLLSPRDVREGARLSRVTVHLATCPHCAAAYAELAAMGKTAWEDVSPAVATPRPSLGFLRREPEPVPWRYQLGRLRIELAALFSPMGLTLASPGGVKSSQAGGEARTLQVPETAAPDLRVTVTCQPVLDSVDRCSLVVKAEVPSRGGWPRQRGIRVILQRGAEVLDQLETDAFGIAVFQNVAVASLPELAVIVAPEG